MIIATDDYDFWPKLVNPVPDAEAVGAVLHDKYGFSVEVLEDQTKKQILDALVRYQGKAYQPGDQLFIFIAGHGDFDDNAKEGYLVAKDTRLPTDDTTRDSFLSHQLLRSYIDQIPAHHVLLMMDVCFGGTFDRGIAESGSRGGMYEDQPVSQLFAERANWTTRKFITSGGKQYVFDGVPGHNSPFVHNLLTELRNPSRDRGYLTFADLQSAVQGTNPPPVWGTWGNDDAGSDFFLISSTARNLVSSTAPNPGSAARSPSRSARTVRSTRNQNRAA